MLISRAIRVIYVLSHNVEDSRQPLSDNLVLLACIKFDHRNTKKSQTSRKYNILLFFISTPLILTPL